jgi:hypothetical protein
LAAAVPELTKSDRRFSAKVRTRADAASFGEVGDLPTVRRQTGTHDLWRIFNPTNRSIAADTSLAAVGTPYWADLWSGNVSPVAQWEPRAEGIRLQLRVAPHQSIAVVVRHDEPAGLHAISATAPLVKDGDDFILIADAPAKLNC